MLWISDISILALSAAAELGPFRTSAWLDVLGGKNRFKTNSCQCLKTFTTAGPDMGPRKAQISLVDN